MLLLLMIQGLVRTTEGLLLKQPASGDKKAPWLIFKKAWGEFKVIGKTPARPTASDIELALYNSSARESPITQGSSPPNYPQSYSLTGPPWLRAGTGG